MKKFIPMFLILMFVCIGNVYSYSSGTNITVYDGSSSSITGWYGQQEDQEVEPGCASNQSWDLEGFYIDGTTLNMVGGFDFINGQDGIQSGDIFIDTNCDLHSPSGYMNGDGYQHITNDFGYNFVFDLNFYNSTYTLYGLREDAILMSVYYEQNEHTNAFQYVSGGILLSNGTFSYQPGLTDSEVGGLLGGEHNVVSLDLNGIGVTNLDNLTAHFTIGCGNDNLVGTTCNPVPEPTTILLLGSGLMAFAGLGRKKTFFNK